MITLCSPETGKGVDGKAQQTMGALRRQKETAFKADISVRGS
jgi:hypothetical protein